MLKTLMLLMCFSLLIPQALATAKKCSSKKIFEHRAKYGSKKNAWRIEVYCQRCPKKGIKKTPKKPQLICHAKGKTYLVLIFPKGFKAACSQIHIKGFKTGLIFQKNFNLRAKEGKPAIIVIPKPKPIFVNTCYTQQDFKKKFPRKTRIAAVPVPLRKKLEKRRSKN